MAELRIIEMAQFRTPGDQYRQLVLPWLVEASRPYCNSMFRTSEELDSTLVEWSQRRSSELWVGHGSLGISDSSEIVGGFLACPGDTLAKSRQMDALAYIRSAPAEDMPRRRRFLEQTSQLFPPVDSADLYLSRIGVLRAHRGRGYGAALLDSLFGFGSKMAFSRIVLDVSSNNEHAIDLYNRVGFVMDSEQHAEELDLGYTRMSKRLA